MNENESSDNIAWDSIKGTSGCGNVPLVDETEVVDDNEMTGEMGSNEVSIALS